MNPSGSTLVPPSAAPHAETGLHPFALRASARRALLGAGVGLLALAAGTSGAGGLGADYVVKALGLFAVAALLIWRGLDAGTHPHRRWGAANGVTSLRLVLVALLAALLGETVLLGPLNATPTSTLWAWGVVGLATLTAVLDAVDGPLARRAGLASAFGARFDMETDAALTLVLCALVWQSGQAGPWVLAAGLMRYAFVAAAWRWPWLDAPLAPSRRRQTVCVVQITSLIICLGPIVPPALATALAAISLGLLSLSFAIDIQALARARR